jgi:heme/copper-type cytochrome/quinol oxidase subunit 3
MHALPAAPPPAPRRQMLVGTALACAAGTAMFGGLLAIFVRFRQSALSVVDGEWKPADSKVPEVATNIMLLSFVAILIFAHWSLYAARRRHHTYTGVALGLVALMALAIINSQAFVYRQMRLGLDDGIYQTLFYAVTGAFVVVMIIGLVFTLVTAFRFIGGRTDDHELVTAHALYWYFTSVVYCALWFVVYVTK